MEKSTQNGPRISELVAQCLSAFDAIVSALDNSPTQASTTIGNAVSHQARFKLWVGYLGAHRPSGTRSLEYRLRDASSLRNHILALLQDLCDSLEEAVVLVEEGENEQIDAQNGSIQDDLESLLSDDESESGADQVFHAIGDVIDCLLRLSVTMRNPAPHDQFRSRAGEGILDSYEKWDIQHVQEKFSNLDSTVAQRLGKALTRRRQYLRYRLQHHNLLSEGIGMDEDTARSEADGRSTIASSLPDHLKDPAWERGPARTDLLDMEDTGSEISQTSYTSSNANSGNLRVPPIPEEYIKGPFLCPFCHMLVSVGSRHDWKKHVFRDLRPYVCISIRCPTSDHQYSRRGDWAKHMRQEHFRSWSCPFGCLGMFHSEQGFRNHIDREHPRELSSKELDTLQSLCSSLNPHAAEGTCPLCFDFEIKTDRQYDSHVGAHLEQLALFVLPQSSEMDTDEEEEEEGEGEDGIIATVSLPLVSHYVVQGDEDLNEWQVIDDDEVGARGVTIEEEGTDRTVDEKAGATGIPSDTTAHDELEVVDATGVLASHLFAEGKALVGGETAAENAAKETGEGAGVDRKAATESGLEARLAALEAREAALKKDETEKKAPIRFKDAIGRNYHFPWERCRRWRDMEGLINQAFAHIENLDEPVQLGRYDLVNPDNETIIMPELWESTVEPGMQITMMLWPIPEPEFPEEGEPPENREIPPGEILTLEDMMNMTTSSKKKVDGKKKRGRFAEWVLRGNRKSKGSGDS